MAVMATVASCKKDETTKNNTFKGPEVSFWHGKAWTTVKLNDDGSPAQLMLTLNDDVLNSVGTTSDSASWHTHANQADIPLPKEAPAPFKFIMLDWNPHGHPPVNIYDKPHFDVHFYMTPEAEVMGYTDTAKMAINPPADYLPAKHIGANAIPMMGKHWMDASSPELHGQPFTQTFLYGSYNGQVVFYEPMMTLEFLKNTPDFQRAIPLPAKYQQAGYYPTIIRISKHDGVTDIILEGFSSKQAS